MKLRSQMLLAAAMTLVVPLVGWQSVKQLYTALQQTRIDEQTLKVANMRLALSEAQDVNQVLNSGLHTVGDRDWYAQTSPYALFVDGYEDDWQTLSTDTFNYSLATESDLQLSVRVARYEQSLHLFVNVSDDSVVYHTPPRLDADAGEGELPTIESQLVNGDSVELLIEQPSTSAAGGLNLREESTRWQHGIFRAIAPGPIGALAGLTDDTLDEWQGTWIKTVGGYQLEIKVPLPASGSMIGLSVVDLDAAGEARNIWAGVMSPRVMRRAYRQQINARELNGAVLFHDSDVASQRLTSWATPGARARLFDAHGRLMADVDNLYVRELPEDEAIDAAGSSDGLWNAILLRVFAFFVAGDLPLLPETRTTNVTLALDEERRASVVDEQSLTTRYVTQENDRVLGTLAPIGQDPRRGYLLFESNEEHTSAYAGSQLARLFSLLLLVSLLAGTGLLIFALVLSSRIRRLSREAQHAVAADGRVRGLPGSDAQDEIGDLSRKLSTLLARSAAYTQYLEALSSRLSHELRTPLSVVRTSLENLDMATLDSQSRQLIDRASGGADQLSAIIKALVESTRLEQTVQMADRQQVNLSEWLAGSLARYQQVYPDNQFSLNPASLSEVSIMVSPELLSQAFDKLVDNAVSFSGEQQAIVLGLGKQPDASADSVSLVVANQGPALDKPTLDQLFEPMFSNRDKTGADRHLGLGLYIVKMIAEAHDGTVFARNEDSWVIIGMRLPVT